MSKTRNINYSKRASQDDEKWLKFMSPHLDKMVNNDLNKYCKICGAPIVNNADGNYQMEMQNEVHFACAQKYAAEQRRRAAEEAKKNNA